MIPFLRSREARARAAFMSRIRITEMEKSDGIELSYPELDGLPTVQIVRNPNDRLGWMPYLGVTYGNSPRRSRICSGGRRGSRAQPSRRSCERRARERLWQVALAKSEAPVEVRL